MEDSNQSKAELSDSDQQEQVKWDYTSSEQTRLMGAVVVGLNVLVALVFLLDRTVPAVHAFITGKAL